jgi:hypothetical protein
MNFYFFYGLKTIKTTLLFTNLTGINTALFNLLTS